MWVYVYDGIVILPRRKRDRYFFSLYVLCDKIGTEGYIIAQDSIMGRDKR